MSFGDTNISFSNIAQIIDGRAPGSGTAISLSSFRGKMGIPSSGPISIQIYFKGKTYDVDIDSGCQKSRMPTTAPVLIHGQIDAVFKDESTKPPPGMSEWIIVDWKTVSVADCDRDALATHYQPQVQLYAYCWSIGLYSE